MAQEPGDASDVYPVVQKVRGDRVPT